MKKYTENLKSAILAICLLSSILTACGTDKSTTEPITPDPVATTGDVTIYVTTNNRSSDFAKKFVDFSKTSNMSPTTITLDPTTTYQTMDGFGAAITGSTCYNLLKMAQADRTKFLKETFSETEGMGQSYIRIAIGCSDFSLSEYTCWDTPGIENFGLQNEENNYIIPILKEILAINPNIKIIAAPWTSPRWMKVNNLTDLQPFNSWTSGQLNPIYYSDYGTYFVKWIQAMAAKGVTINAVTPQNEPLNRGNSASLYMGWEEQLAFIKTALGPKLKAAGLATKIYLFDHNYDYDKVASQNDYPVNIYKDAAAAAYVAGAAYHNYGGDKAELLDIHNQRPDKDLIFTETSIGTWNDGQNLSTRLMDDMQDVGLGTINNWSKAVIVWNLMLDTERGPNREGGCQTCYGAVDINKSDYKTITKNSHYYIIGHLSAVVKPGAVRIGASGYSATGVTYSAFKNTDGTYAFVLLNNTTDVKNITLSDGVKHFSYSVPSKSIVSYRW
ncbi:glycoside hydrolase family 30, candidate beta-glycosidase [Arcticibacter svalbardensis MN12-7]|uniref:Glycoside hydrolase family 30, candidate beta-glycosidase n=1 Tax=Arcticibacter svalbardensis MN12-7 TaxID=1150600 RepID=R9H2T6_9SPHI|nr:glycoside hydrolase family 30 beta sandwich domain-containing protein [Arcticibacter svalbardensis]EOR95519.1 glycoside hydrolase family 30, candidate beta-glycosidase [Arcticibacter svalbardensis MN12-7]